MPSPADRAAVRRRAIVTAAVAIADRDGAEALSMRSLAEQLGLGTMTLYTYVADKDELLDLMLDAVSAEMLVPEPMPADWREALTAIARRTRDTLDAHPWIFDSNARRPRRRLNTLRHIEQSLAAVEPLDAADAAGAILMAVDDYVVGHVYRSRMRRRLLREHRAAAAARNDPAPAPPGDPAISDALAAGELPRLARRLEGGPLGAPPEADFALGLRWLLAGIAAEFGSGEAPGGLPHPSSWLYRA